MKTRRSEKSCGLSGGTALVEEGTTSTKTQRHSISGFKEASAGAN